MNLKDAITVATQRLSAEPIGPPARAAEALLLYVLGCDRAYLHAHPERVLTTDEQKRFDEGVARRAAGEPLQYITGHQEFYGLDFEVTPAVLIPRPETEHLVEAALELLAPMPNARVVDVGTGSGCIALAIAHGSKKTGRAAEVHAIDISPEALAVARRNAARLGLADAVAFYLGDLLMPFADSSSTFDMVVSNPPYVGRNEADKVQREVREHEPEVAVFGGAEGLDIYRRLVPQALAALKPGGHFLMEIGYSIEAQVLGLLHGFEHVRTVADLQGIPRVVVARKPGA